MRILLFSDSHGDIQNMVRAVTRNRNIGMIIHLGDCVGDILKIREQFGDVRYEFIRGNNDWGREYPLEKNLEIEGKSILITHGHLYNVKNDYQRIAARGRAIQADAVFFGHTHEPEEFFSDSMLVLNPGSIGGARAHCVRPTYCIVEISGEKLASRFMGTV